MEENMDFYGILDGIWVNGSLWGIDKNEKLERFQ
jgi:hypothetical protein